MEREEMVSTLSEEVVGVGDSRARDILDTLEAAGAFEDDVDAEHHEEIAEEIKAEADAMNVRAAADAARLGRIVECADALTE